MKKKQADMNEEINKLYIENVKLKEQLKKGGTN